MTIPEVGTKFLYNYNNVCYYMGEIYGESLYYDIFASNNDYPLLGDIEFNKDFIINTSQKFKFISEVDSIEQAMELYPEYFI